MTLEPRKTCSRPNCLEPRYGTYSICRIHNNERQRNLYAANKAANPLPPPPPKPKMVWCKDCIAEESEEPLPRIPGQSYCQPHRAKRSKIRYQLFAAATKEERDAVVKQQRTDDDQYEREWESGMHRKPPKGTSVPQVSESEYLRRLRDDVK